jgi:YD repeat-containing protein
LSGTGPSPVALKVTNLDGSWSKTVFDKFGRKRYETFPAFEGHTRTKYYRYDFFGNVSQESLPIDGLPTSSGNEARYVVRDYGPSGRLWRETQPNGRVVTYDYGLNGAQRWQSVSDGGVRKSYAIKSAGGRLLTNVDGVGNQRCYAYDPAGSLHSTWVLKAGIGAGTPSSAACLVSRL